MIVPTLSARIEQRHDFSGEGVLPVNMIQFGAVADRARESQVVQRRRPASADRMNVIQFKAADLKLTGQQAVFAPFAGSLNDGAAKRF